MNVATERRLLQGLIAAACLVPLYAGASSLVEGPAFLLGVERGGPVDLDSHYRYLSGLLFALGLVFASCVANVERKTARFRLLGLVVVVGGIGRLISLIDVGVPSGGHVFGLAMELMVVPLLVLWQGRIAARTRAAPPAP
jgi:hypothetical protein